MKKYYIFIVLLLSNHLVAEETKIYSYVDVKGVRIYTDTPPANRSTIQHYSMSPPPKMKQDMKIYKFVDSKGVIHFTDQPKGSRYKLLSHSQRLESIHPKFKEYKNVIKEVANSTGLEAALLHAIIQAESAYNPTVISPKGAVGLMQLMPDTAQRYGVKDRTNASSNITGGAQYLSYLLTLFDNNIDLALAGYNAGENAVKRYKNTIPPYPETQNYVKKVMKLYSIYQNMIVFDDN